MNILRTGITGPDAFTDMSVSGVAGAGGVNLTPTGGNPKFQLDPESTLAGAQATWRLALYSYTTAGGYVPYGETEDSVPVTAAGESDGAGNHLCPRLFFDVYGAAAVYPIAVSVTGGAWRVAGGPTL